MAIKVLHRRGSVDRRAVARFSAEARAAQRIGHPNIVGVEALGEMRDGRRYHVMELVEGGTLGDLLAQRGRLGADEALPILSGIAQALEAAHAQGITHRDLKLDNVLVARDADGVAVPIRHRLAPRLRLRRVVARRRDGAPRGLPRRRHERPRPGDRAPAGRCVAASGRPRTSGVLLLACRPRSAERGS
ncbi:MAG: protein kinase [Deltaproteobacteria bacterium]|nr:protein kinase [Deltaproteobacteria bacterium]